MDRMNPRDIATKIVVWACMVISGTFVVVSVVMFVLIYRAAQLPEFQEAVAKYQVRCPVHGPRGDGCL